MTDLAKQDREALKKASKKGAKKRQVDVINMRARTRVKVKEH